MQIARGFGACSLLENMVFRVIERKYHVWNKLKLWNRCGSYGFRDSAWLGACFCGVGRGEKAPGPLTHWHLKVLNLCTLPIHSYAPARYITHVACTCRPVHYSQYDIGMTTNRGSVTDFVSFLQISSVFKIQALKTVSKLQRQENQWLISYLLSLKCLCITTFVRPIRSN